MYWQVLMLHAVMLQIVLYCKIDTLELQIKLTFTIDIRIGFYIDLKVLLDHRTKCSYITKTISYWLAILLRYHQTGESYSIELMLTQTISFDT